MSVTNYCIVQTKSAIVQNEVAFYPLSNLTHNLFDTALHTKQNKKLQSLTFDLSHISIKIYFNCLYSLACRVVKNLTKLVS